MNKKLVLTYSHGGGGSWLGNLVWHLCNNDFTLPIKNNNVYDGNPISNPLMNVHHAFEYYNPKQPKIFEWENFEIIRYGTSQPFQLYLNEVSKVRFTHLGYGNMPLTDQFDAISNAAKAWMTDPTAIAYYCNNLDLDMKLLFTDREEFISQLFAILDRRAIPMKIPYAKNIDYCRQSIKKYKDSCPDPKDHIGNRESLLWLAWCHAIMMVNKIVTPSLFNFSTTQSLEQIAEAIDPVHEQCLALSRPWYFLWNENE